MNHVGSTSSCRAWCFVIAGLIGALVFVLLLSAGDWRLFPAFLTGVIVAAIGVFVFPKVFCRGSDEPVRTSTNAAGAGSSTSDSAPASAAAATAGSAATSTATASTAPASLMATPSAEAETKADDKTKPAKKAAAKKSPAKTQATKKPAAKKPAPKATTKTAAKPKAAPVAKDGKPPLLKKARAGGADDLKQIKGVGPGLEKTLNELGFYHFDQIAGWRKKEIEWVDERLKFKGRIVRDDWVKQCKTLAKGGTTEFSKRVKKGDVY